MQTRHIYKYFFLTSTLLLSIIIPESSLSGTIDNAPNNAKFYPQRWKNVRIQSYCNNITVENACRNTVAFTGDYYRYTPMDQNHGRWVVTGDPTYTQNVTSMCKWYARNDTFYQAPSHCDSMNPNEIVQATPPNRGYPLP